MKKMHCSLICLSLMIMICGCAGNVPADTSVTEEGSSGTVITETDTPEAAVVQEVRDYNVLELDVPRDDNKSFGKLVLPAGETDLPLSYSEKAESCFQDAKLVTIEGAGHGFYGEDMEEAAKLSFSFIRNILGQAAGDPAEQSSGEEADADMEMKLLIGNTPVEVFWEENASTEALKELIKISPLEIRMSMYGGFEQVGAIGTSLPKDDVQTTTSAGDIVLYSGNQIVVFYGSNSWAYTRLGKITDKSAADLEGLLGNGDVTITIFPE